MSSAQHSFPTWRVLHKLACDEDDGCLSQEEAGLNRATVGNTGNEPGGRQTIQHEVAQTEQEGANSGKECQDPKHPLARCEQPRTCGASGPLGKRAHHREQTSGEEPQTRECLTLLDQEAEECGVGHDQSLQHDNEETWQASTPESGAQHPTELIREGTQEDLIDPSEQPGVADDELKT